MNVSELKYRIESHYPESRFFSRENMKFSGDTMANFGVRSVVITDVSGQSVECWQLYRKRVTRKGFGGSFYFAKSDYSRVFSAN